MRNYYIPIILTTAWINGVYSSDTAPSKELTFSSNSEEKFVDVVHYLVQDYSKTHCESSLPLNTITLEVAVNQNQIHVRSAKKQSLIRNYYATVTPEEKSDLAYITNTLARNSLPSIATSKSSIKKAGDRIDHLHPLRFLMAIFTDEELKANISAIRSRGWVWDKFYDGLEGSLKQESKKENMRIEFIIDFASTIGINASLIQTPIQENRWKDFVNLLIDTVPRSGNPGRYDM